MLIIEINWYKIIYAASNHISPFLMHKIHVGYGEHDGDNVDDTAANDYGNNNEYSADIEKTKYSMKFFFI